MSPKIEMLGWDMSEKPTILVGRKLPEAVEARLQRDYNAILNPDDTLYLSLIHI